ncbi:MAG: hypothetical protein IJ671_07415 [Succinivibrio sp.]|nr:hypothetical protein [Succinivibrio sp.]
MSSFSNNTVGFVNSSMLRSLTDPSSTGGASAAEFGMSMNSMMDEMSVQNINQEEIFAISPVSGGGNGFLAPSGGALTPRNDQSFAEVLQSELGTGSSVTPRQTLEDRFSVLNQKYDPQEWQVLEGNQAEESDFSVLETLGDGLMTALKFAANAYIGKVI